MKVPLNDVMTTALSMRLRLLLLDQIAKLIRGLRRNALIHTRLTDSCFLYDPKTEKVSFNKDWDFTVRYGTICNIMKDAEGSNHQDEIPSFAAHGETMYFKADPCGVLQTAVSIRDCIGFDEMWLGCDFAKKLSTQHPPPGWTAFTDTQAFVADERMHVFYLSRIIYKVMTGGCELCLSALVAHLQTYCFTRSHLLLECEQLVPSLREQAAADFFRDHIPEDAARYRKKIDDFLSLSWLCDEAVPRFTREPSMFPRCV